MRTVDPITAFLVQLHAALRRYWWIGRQRRRDILREVESHLRESADVLAVTLGEAGAAKEAVRRFGRADELAQQYATVYQQGVHAMLKAVIGILAGLTSLSAVVTMVHTLGVPEGGGTGIVNLSS